MREKFNSSKDGECLTRKDENCNIFKVFVDNYVCIEIDFIEIHEIFQQGNRI